MCQSKNQKVLINIFSLFLMVFLILNLGYSKERQLSLIKIEQKDLAQIVALNLKEMVVLKETKENVLVIVKFDDLNLLKEKISIEVVEPSIPKLVQIYLSTPSEFKLIQNLPIDIWEVRKDTIVAGVKIKQLETLKNNGVSFKILHDNIYIYLKNFEEQNQTTEYDVHYLSYKEIVGYIEFLSRLSPFCEAIELGESWEGRKIMALKISDYPEIENPWEANILFVGGHHAREWISYDVPMRLAFEFAKYYGSNQTITDIIEHAQLFFVPCLNPDGLVYSRNVDRFWRKNRRNNGDGTFGVDLNRNYPFHWGEGPASNHSTSDVEYCGPYPFSEPETRALNNLLVELTHPFIGIMSFHSYGEKVLYPWGYTEEAFSFAPIFENWGNEMADLINSVHDENYECYQCFRLYNKPTCGILMDYCLDQFGSFSYSIELRPQTWFGGGFALPEDQIMPTVEEIFPAATHFSLLLTNLNYWRWTNFVGSNWPLPEDLDLTLALDDKNWAFEEMYENNLVKLDQTSTFEGEAQANIADKPLKYDLGPNFPNPFNAQTQIEYQLPEAARVTIKIFNLLGQEVITLVNDQLNAGNYSVIWNGKNANGNDVPSGAYLCKMKAKSNKTQTIFTANRKLLLIK